MTDQKMQQEDCNSALRAEPASQHDAGAAVLSALRDGIPLQEPVSITRAVLAQREARVSLSGGTGPVACAMLVNIQLTGWAEGPEKAEAFASGYNSAMKWHRSALLDLAERVGADADPRCRAEGGITNLDGIPKYEWWLISRETEEEYMKVSDVLAAIAAKRATKET